MNEIQPTFIFSLDIPVRWYDMDAFGHVNNSVYFTYFEQTRATWWDTIRPEGITYTDIGPVIVNAFCTFRRAIVYPETLCVKLYISSPSRSSYEHHYEIYSANNPEILYATGSTKVVWVDRAKAKSTRLPDWIKQHLPT
ncbi:MAG: thioesterase family protein [Gammaproteobacteria bacterium]|nr:thioesterase family protein [Gammaproteobacteria bacterium]